MSAPVALPAYQFLPALSDADFEALKADIAARGVLIAVEYDEDGNVLDGHHRLKACAELGIAEWPRIVRHFDGEADKRTHARQLNIARRHLNQEQRRALIAEDLKDRPERSNRQIASDLGVDHKTVAAVRNEAEAGGEIPHHTTRIGSDGVKQPARKPTVSRIHLPGDDGAAAVKVEAKAVRDAQTEAKRAANEDVKAAPVAVPAGKFSVLVIDPPWPMEKIEREVRPNQVAFDYPVMQEDELAAFGSTVGMLAADDCHAFVWTTHRFLPMALRLLPAWGLRYVLTMVWHKPGGFQPIGLPQYNCEFVLYARAGSPRFIDTKAFPCCFDAPRREHSRKPDEFYDVIRRVTDGRRIDIFSREARDGFEQFGNEAHKFAGAA